MSNGKPIPMLIGVGVFAIAFAFVESSVVVYLRALYYPQGFFFPLKIIPEQHIVIELWREAATIIMLSAVAFLTGEKGWQRFGFFCFAFGLWDIFFYFWLKVVVGWPATVFEWDILFLIPMPWIGPVFSALMIASVLTLCGVDIVVRTSSKKYFHPPRLSWLLSVAGAATILYSFMHDTGATLGGKTPLPYRFELLTAGFLLFVAAYIIACTPRRRKER